ncbi:MAG: SDR family NAD(P)-dependent oxidoreductase [Acidimicrobiales bacterium]
MTDRAGPTPSPPPPGSDPDRPDAGRIVVITGAGRGLGLGLARRFAARGATVVGTVRSGPDPALAAVARTATLVVTSDASIAALADDQADLDRIDVLINSSGINATAAGADRSRRGVTELNRPEFLAVMDVNAAGPLLVTRALLPGLERGHDPLVVNISSQLGSLVFAAGSGADVAYNASKAALNMITVRQAAELADRGIRVMAVHPGWVRTDMGGSAASLTVEDAAASIADTVGRFGPDDTGRFVRWDGTPHPW